MHIDVLGKRYEVRYCSQFRKTRGDCDPPEAKGKQIRLATWLDDEQLLEVAIHEFKHADDWHKFDEGYVRRFAQDLQRFIWRLGYRRNATEGETVRGEKRPAGRTKADVG